MSRLLGVLVVEDSASDSKLIAEELRRRHSRRDAALDPEAAETSGLFWLLLNEGAPAPCGTS